MIMVAQRFPKGPLQIPYIVTGAGGYTKLGKLQLVNGAYPKAPLAVTSSLTLEQYDQDNFGFLRLEVSKNQIIGTYLSAPYSVGGTPAAKVADSFTVDLTKKTVKTGTVAQAEPGNKNRDLRRRSDSSSLKGSRQPCQTFDSFPDIRGPRESR